MSGLLAKLNNRMRDTTGAAIVLVALSMVALLSAVALSVDVGMLVTARAESQALSDAAALAGAGILRDTNGNVDQTYDETVQFASTNNTVRGAHVPAADVEVQIIPDEWTVRVRVETAQSTFFARIFGVNQVDIATKSAAWAVESSTIGSGDDDSCPALPLTLLDKYNENGDDPGWQPDANPPEEIVGWDETDHGKLLRLYQKKNAPDERPEVHNYSDYCLETTQGSSYRCYWHQDTPNVPDINKRIEGEECEAVGVGDTVVNASGAKQAAIAAWSGLIQNDPHGLSWDPDIGEGGCVVAAAAPDKCFTGTSKRLRTVPVLDPTTLVDGQGGGQQIDGVVVGFQGVFVENAAPFWDAPLVTSGWGSSHVYLRLVQVGGDGPSNEEPGENNPEATVRDLQLIE